MAYDTLVVYAGVYNNVEDAKADYDAVKLLHTELNLLDAYDAAVVTKREDGKVKILAKHETPTRYGALIGGGIGLASGVVVALFPAVLVGGGLLLGSTGLGAVLGSIAGHAVAGMSRGDIKELGDTLDAGQAALVVVGVSDIEGKIDKAMAKADKIERKELKADADALKKDIDEAVKEAEKS